MIKLIRDQIYDLNKKGIFVSLSIIGIIGLFLRLYFEPQTALTGDSTNYFVYAVDTSLKGKLSDEYFLANSGWSIFLSMIFSMTQLDDPLFLMELQRYVSIFISVFTIIPVYFLCRKFFNIQYSLIGAALFVFEPHVVINSTLGIGGIFDVASYYGIKKQDKEDYGQTLGAWGVGEGCYFILPVLGPTTVRDSIGSIANLAGGDAWYNVTVANDTQYFKESDYY